MSDPIMKLPPPGRGRAKGSATINPTPQVRRMLNQRNIVPVDKLIELAKKAEEAGQLETARKIWSQLTDLSYAKPKPLKTRSGVPANPSNLPGAPGDDVPSSQLLSIAGSTPPVPKPDGGSTS